MVEVHSNGRQGRVEDGTICLGTFTLAGALVFRRAGGVALLDDPPDWADWQQAMREVHDVDVVDVYRPVWCR